ncbi:hypothetical protein CH380_19375 [Leptospira adleri]|uniref:Uncharacterized protein n=1 Tax=Leptospira adleri TaxID=2023186 RepID=A0A2M9YJ91_9LEPT|nr:hypothetical protein CH380_19375 [Leptospira adleri]PJZ61882.1 hypothetical protein CH376_10790 [Leptospira adleri]
MNVIFGMLFIIAIGIFYFAQWVNCTDSEILPSRWFEEFKANVKNQVLKRRELSALKAANSYLEDSKSRPADSFFYKPMRHINKNQGQK